MTKTMDGDYSATDAKLTLIAGWFNSTLVERLVSGAVEALRRHGIDESNITVIRVPGAYEIPLIAKRVAAKGGIDAVVALGAVIRGETPHFDYVAGECASGLARVSMETGVPVTFGVLTTDTVEQALDRAGGKAGNKGADAALAALEMISLLRQIE